MIDSMLEPHMKDSAGASQTDVVVAFIIYAGVYTVAGIVAGYVSFYQRFIFQLLFISIITLRYIKYLLLLSLFCFSFVIKLIIEQSFPVSET